MRLIKLGLISVIGLFIVILLISLLIPSTARVSRAVTIEAPADSVRAFLSNMRNWPQWNSLLQNEQWKNPTVTEKLFHSEQMDVEILSIDSAMIVTSWKRTGQDAVGSNLGITAAGNATIVNAYFDFKVKWYPWEKFGSIVFDKEMGPPLEKSLGNLKNICEKH